MSYERAAKNRKLDFNRETFNEPMLQMTHVKEDHFKVPLASITNRVSSNSFADDEEEESLASCSSNSLTNPLNNNLEENVGVYLRVRPCTNPSSLYTFDKNKNKVIISQNSLNNTTNTEKHYSFTGIYDKVTQAEVYDKSVRHILNEPFDISGATFASYGCSSSGKTYTIFGDSSAGLVPRAITHIFIEYCQQISSVPCVKFEHDNKLRILNDSEADCELDLTMEFIAESKKLFKGKSHSWKYETIISEHKFEQKHDDVLKFRRMFVWVSMVEIYNEKIADLFTIQQKGATIRPLKIHSNAGRSYVNGVTWLFVSSIAEAFEVFYQGLNRVSYATTGINAHSSRSHTIFTFNVIGEMLCGSEYQLTSFKFCDLAGAERLKKTGNIGERLKEAGTINTSLLVLGRCLESVIQNQKKGNKKHVDTVIPVRDSKLTFLIQSSLLGREKFTMIVNICPSADFFEENFNVLKFGSIANQIVVKKSELRKYKRHSIRYSYFNDAIASPMKNTTRNSSTIAEESELDDSFYWNEMSKEELINNLRRQKVEIEIVRHYLEQSERNSLLKERELRNEHCREQEELKKKYSERNKENEEIQNTYHERKLESQRIRYERKLNEANEEIDRLLKIIKKLNPNQKIYEDEDDEDDVFEIDDDDDEEEAIFEN